MSPPVIVLHVGTMKSGTTYLQSRLEHHRETLAADGVLFPGPRWKDQLRAVGDALDRAPDGDLSSGSGRWASMAEQMLGWTGPRVILSVEHLSRAGRTQARAIVASLAPAELQVAITARDLGRDIPSTWQQEIKAGRGGTFDAFLRALSTPSGGSDPMAVLARRFWRRHDPAALSDRWGSAIRGGRITVVTVPPAGAPPDALWQRFARAVGLDADRYPAPGDDLPLNPSLGAAGVELIRRLNERLGDRVAQGPHRDLVKFAVANSTLAGRADDPRLQVPAEHRGWVADRAAAIVAQLRSAGVRVVGDLDDLVPVTVDTASPVAEADPHTANAPAQVPAHAMAAAAVQATAALLRKAATAPGVGGNARRRSVLGEHESAAQRRAALDPTPYDRTLDPPGSGASTPG